ncbi:MAG: thioredoxin [Candidatus Dojkabacteria bacterium]
MSLLHLKDDTFKSEVTDFKGVVLVDFWAPWCGPCMMLTSTMEELATEMEGKAKVAKVNVDEEGNLAQHFQIMSIPAVFVFKDGEVVETLIGAQSKESYKEALEKHV